MLQRAVLSAVLCAAGCRQAPPVTQIMLVLNAEVTAAARIAEVTVDVSGRAAQASEFVNARREHFVPEPGDWPLELALVPAHNDESRRYRVVATALDAEGVVVGVLRAEGGYQKGVVRELPLTFDAACLDRATPCRPDQSCEQGRCVDPGVDVDLLDDYADAENAQDQPEAGVVADAGAGEDGGEGAGPGVCDVDNGGCESNQRCVDDAGRPECQACPADALDDRGGCRPALSELVVSGGELSPAFSPDQTQYTVKLPLLSRSIELRLQAPLMHAVSIGGQSIDPSRPWRSPPLAYGETPLSLRVSAPGGSSRDYSLTLRREGAQVAYLKASNADAGDSFGRTVAAAGDVVVVGAYWEDSSATGVDGDQDNNDARDSGAAYVFQRREDGGFEQVAYLKPDDTFEDMFFGSSLAIDGETLLIGAIGGNSVLPGAGAAYVFARDGDSWRQQAKLQPGDAIVGDWFGVTVEVAGDTALVAAPDRLYGAVYVYRRQNESWSMLQRLAADEPSVGGRFGTSLALDGDRLVVGASEDSALANEAGAAYVFERDDQAGEFSLRQVLHAPEAHTADWFGYAVAVDGERIAVGAPQADVGATDSGQAVVFEREGTQWRATQTLLPAGATQSALFGSSLALRDDGLLLVGAQGQSNGGRGFGTPQNNQDIPSSGGAYVFGRSEGEFGLDTYIKASNPGVDDTFGYVLDTHGDLLVVGAQWESSGSREVDGDQTNDDRYQSGAAYVFR